MKLLDTFISHRELPVNLIDNDLILFESELKKVIEETRLLTLKNVSISSEGLIFKYFNILKESYSNDYICPSFSIVDLKAHVKFLLRNSILRKSIFLQEDDYLWITDEYSYNYFHWLLDVIPRLIVALKEIKKPKIILPYHYKSIKFIEESLKALPISRLTFMSENEVYRLDKLIVPTHTALTGNYNDSIIKKVRQIYRDYYFDKQSVFLGDKIYISRSNIGRRKIINEEEVFSLLKQYGFESVTFETLSFSEQVSIAFNAKYLISNHGAGLTNMLFMEAGSSVFELRKAEDKYNNCYFSLASALNLKYYYQNCISEFDNSNATSPLNLNPTMKEWAIFHFADIVVDIEELRANINFMLSSDNKNV